MLLYSETSSSMLVFTFGLIERISIRILVQ